MSMSAQDLTSRQLIVGMVKVAVILVVGVILVAMLATWLAGGSNDLLITLLFVSIIFMLFTNGILAVLKIVDWFEARKSRQNG